MTEKQAKKKWRQECTKGMKLYNGHDGTSPVH